MALAATTWVIRRINPWIIRTCVTSCCVVGIKFVCARSGAGATAHGKPGSSAPVDNGGEASRKGRSVVRVARTGAAMTLPGYFTCPSAWHRCPWRSRGDGLIQALPRSVSCRDGGSPRRGGVRRCQPARDGAKPDATLEIPTSASRKRGNSMTANEAYDGRLEHPWLA